MPAEDVAVLEAFPTSSPKAFSSFKMAVGETPWPRLPKWLKKFDRISSGKHNQMSSFCLNNGFRLQKTNRAARRWKRPPTSHFIMCHVAKYSTICGVFQQPWPGVSPTAILNEEKALRTRLGAFRVRQEEFKFNFNPTPAVLMQNAKSLI